MPREQINELLGVIFSPENIFFVAVFIGFIALVGYFSYRFLRSLPHFEHKAEMLWGAKWLWAVVIATPTLAFVITYLGMIYSPYFSTTILMGIAVFYIIVGLSFLFLDHQIRGSLAIFDLLNARFRGQKFDLEAWLERERQMHHKQRRISRIVFAVWLLMAAVCVYYAVARAYPLDRDLAERFHMLEMTQILKRELESPLVKGVLPNLPFRQEPYELEIRVSENTTPTQAEEVLLRTQRALAKLSERRRWNIIVTYCGKKTFATGLYDPRSPAPSQ